LLYSYIVNFIPFIYTTIFYIFFLLQSNNKKALRKAYESANSYTKITASWTPRFKSPTETIQPRHWESPSWWYTELWSWGTVHCQRNKLSQSVHSTNGQAYDVRRLWRSKH